jgi:hypothetical protein
MALPVPPEMVCEAQSALVVESPSWPEAAKGGRIWFCAERAAANVADANMSNVFMDITFGSRKREDWQIQRRHMW